MDKIVPNNLKCCQNRRKKSPKKTLTETCQVCGDKASKQQHYGSKAIVCFSCRAFFRRCVQKKKKLIEVQCNSFLLQASGTCQIKPETRSVCRYVSSRLFSKLKLNIFLHYFSFCRYKKCCLIGMKAKFVMTIDDIAEMKEKAKDAKRNGIQSKYLAPTTCEKQCSKSQKEMDWETEEEFLLWLLKDDQINS